MPMLFVHVFELKFLHAVYCTICSNVCNS